jgi:hypothetical protein
MQNVSNRPKKSQIFNREASCYELRWAPVNPSHQKIKLALAASHATQVAQSIYSNCFRNSANCLFKSAISFCKPAISLSSSLIRVFSFALLDTDASLGGCDSRTSTSPDNRCTYRASLLPDCRGNTFTSGGSRSIKCFSVDCTTLKSSNGCIRSARPRNSPGVCGPRNNNSHKMAVSGRVKLKVSARRCSYFATRPSPLADLASICSPNPRKACRTASSSRCISGSRLDFWLHALTSAFNESG